MQADPNISEFVALSAQVGLDADFNDPTKIMTVLAPQDGAMTVPPTDPEILAMLENFIIDGQALTEADIAAGATTPAARGGAVYAVVAGPPLTIGTSGIVTADMPGANGFVQVMQSVPVPN
jgi:hypothetical protein